MLQDQNPIRKGNIKINPVQLVKRNVYEKSNLWYSNDLMFLLHSITEQPCYKDESIIVNKIIDTVYVNEVRPKYVFIGEQPLSELKNYLSSKHDQKNDGLSLLINDKWSYLNQVKTNSLSKTWKQISLPNSIDGKKMITEKKKGEENIFSPVQFSPDGTRAFVVYYRTVENIRQTIVFFFFEFKNGNWIHAAHYIPYLE